MGEKRRKQPDRSRHQEAIRRQQTERAERTAPPGISILTIFDYMHMKDDEGRPIRESSSFEEIIRAQRMRGISFETAPYTRDDSPSRQSTASVSYKYDKAALDQIRRHYKFFKGGLHYFRSHALGRRDQSEQLSLQDMYFVTALASAVPSYILSQPNSPYRPSALPARAAVMYKALLGVNSTIDSIIEALGIDLSGVQTSDSFLNYSTLYDPLPGLQASPPLYATPEEILQRAEDQKNLRGDIRVCAAPSPMIIDVLKTLIHGANGIEPEHIDYWKTMVPDPDRMLVFAMHARYFSGISKIYEGKAEDLVTSRQTLQNEFDTYTPAEQVGATRHIHALYDQFRIYQDAHTRQLNLLQPVVNTSLGRAPDVRPIIPRQVSAFYFGMDMMRGA